MKIFALRLKRVCLVAVMNIRHTGALSGCYCLLRPASLMRELVDDVLLISLVVNGALCSTYSRAWRDDQTSSHMILT
eukprot:6490482-Amphidinium_carterae.1